MSSMTMALPLFLLAWVPMMAVMMVPSTAPTAILWTRTMGGRSLRRTRRLSAFLTGYLIAWAAYGVGAWVLVGAGHRLMMSSPREANWLGAGLFIGAGIYQLTPMKQACLRKCRTPFGRVVLYSGWSGPARDLRAGLQEGGLCVACCWGLMIVLVAVGTMNLAAMAVLAVVTALEKLWRHGPAFARAIGVGFIAIGLVALVHPQLLTGFGTHQMVGQMSGDMSGMSGMAASPAVRWICEITRIAGRA